MVGSSRCGIQNGGKECSVEGNGCSGAGTMLGAVRGRTRAVASELASAWGFQNICAFYDSTLSSSLSYHVVQVRLSALSATPAYLSQIPSPNLSIIRVLPHAFSPLPATTTTDSTPANSVVEAEWLCPGQSGSLRIDPRRRS